MHRISLLGVNQFLKIIRDQLHFPVSLNVIMYLTILCLSVTIAKWLKYCKFTIPRDALRKDMADITRGCYIRFRSWAVTSKRVCFLLLLLLFLTLWYNSELIPTGASACALKATLSHTQTFSATAPCLPSEESLQVRAWLYTNMSLLSRSLKGWCAPSTSSEKYFPAQSHLKVRICLVTCFKLLFPLLCKNSLKVFGVCLLTSEST